MSGINISCQVLSGGQSQKIAVSSTSAQSAALTTTSYFLTTDVDVFCRVGTSPTAVADGTDQIFLASNSYRVLPVAVGAKFAFITSGASGNVYLTPEA